MNNAIFYSASLPPGDVLGRNRDLREDGRPGADNVLFIGGQGNLDPYSFNASTRTYDCLNLFDTTGKPVYSYATFVDFFAEVMREQDFEVPE